MSEVQLVSTVEAARMLAFLGYSISTVRRWCEMGAKGPFPNAIRAGVGSHWRIPVTDVEAWADEMRPKVVRRRKLRREA